MPKICLDARGNHFGGVYTYTYAMLRTLPNASEDFDYLVLLDDKQVEEGRLQVPNIEYRQVPVMSPAKMVWWNNFQLPKLLEKEKIDLYHGFKHFGLVHPKQQTCRMIWVLRTASWWLFPELFSLQERLFWQRYYQMGAKRLDQVICVAHADKKAFVDAIGVSPEKVEVTQLAADQRFKKPTDQHYLSSTRAKYGLPNNFMVFVGTIYPFKNIETIVKVFANAVKNGNLPHHLVLVGGISPAYGDAYKQQIIQLAESLSVADRLHWIGSVFDDLAAVYTLADLLLFPSVFEAFAKPPLEAMACETPVVASNAAGLPEVIGDAGLMRDPHDVDGLTEDVLRVLTDPGLAQTLIERGKSQVAKFTWERCARETTKVYEKVLNS